MSESSDVAAGEDATSDQYNDLRKDVRDPALGHDHEGVEGVVLDGGVAIAAGTITEDRLNTALKNKLMNFRTAAIVTNGALASLTTVLDLTTTKGVLNGIYIERATATGSTRVKITVDGVVIIDNTGPSLDTGHASIYLSAGGTLEGDAAGTGGPKESGGIQIWFVNSLKVEIQSAATGNTSRVMYATQIA